MATNKFADLSNAEFNKGHKGFIAQSADFSRFKRAVTNSLTTRNTPIPSSTFKSTKFTRRTTSTVKTTTTRPVIVPLSFDWRNFGAISSVKDQGFYLKRFKYFMISFMYIFKT